MSRLFFLWCAFVFVIPLIAQNNTFYRKYNLGGMQGALQLEITDDGGFVGTGQHEGNGSHGDCDIYAYKLDVCGNIEWFKLYGTGAQEGGKSIIKMNDGGFLVSGLYSGSGTYRAFNMKIDAQGNLVWIQRYSFEWMMYAKEAANGDIICLGRNQGSLFLMRTNPTGAIIWSKQILGCGDMGLWLDELNNGDIVFTSVNSIPSKDFSVGRLTNTGNPIWMKSYGGTGWADVDHSSWSIKGLVDTTTNSLVINSLTTSGGLTDHNILLAKLSLSDGTIIWSKVVGGNGRDQSRDITKYPGGYAILGHTSSFPTPANPAANIYEALGEKDILLFSITEGGQLNWARTYGGTDRDKGIGVKYNNDNGFTISAITTSPYFGNTDASFDPLFIKTDSVGFVGCQMHSPTITFNPITLTSVSTGTVSSANIATNIPTILVDDFLPSDQYICQTCTSIPDFTISDTTVCVNDSVYFYNTTMIGLTCFQQWNVNGLELEGTIDPVAVFPNPGTYTIFLYSSCGVNSDTIVKTITVIDPQLNVPPYLCADAPPVQLTSSYAPGSWSGTNVSPSGLFTIGNLSPGYHDVIYTVPQYCAVEDSIEIRPLPYVNAGPDTSLCFESNMNLQGSVLANSSVIWSPSTYLSSINSNSPLLQFDNTGYSNVVFTYTYTLTDNNSTCSAADQVEITVFPVPPLNAGNDVNVCLGDSYMANATGPGSLTWEPNLSNGSIFNLGLGLHPLVVQQIDNNGCIQSDTVVVTVVENPTVNAGNDTLICFGSSLPLNATSAQQVTYIWNVNASNNSNYTPLVPGVLYLSVIVEDNNQCNGFDTLLVQVQDIPNADFSFVVDCYSTAVQLTNETTFNNLFGDQLNINWYGGNQLISNTSGSFTHDFLGSGNVLVSLTAQTAMGNCLDSSAQVIEVPTNPVIDFSYLQRCDYIADFQAIVPLNETIMSNLWNFGNSEFGTNDLSPTYQFAGPGSYQIQFTITNDYPCTYTTQQTVILDTEETLEEQTIPNVITVNQDGINDLIDFSAIIDACLEYEVVIVNRWGNVVFKTTQSGPAFQGKNLDGTPLLEGIYFYKISSGASTQHGHITIVN